VTHLPVLPKPSRGREAVQRPRWQQVARRAEGRVRKPLRLWFPLTALVIILSPLLLLVMAVAIFSPRPLGMNPIDMMLSVGRVLMALSGTEVEVQSDHRPVNIKIF
jgi:hypothetical protein